MWVEKVEEGTMKNTVHSTHQLAGKSCLGSTRASRPIKHLPTVCPVHGIRTAKKRGQCISLVHLIEKVFFPVKYHLSHLIILYIFTFSYCCKRKHCDRAKFWILNTHRKSLWRVQTRLRFCFRFRDWPLPLIPMFLRSQINFLYIGRFVEFRGGDGFQFWLHFPVEWNPSPSY